MNASCRRHLHHLLLLLPSSSSSSSREGVEGVLDASLPRSARWPAAGTRGSSCRRTARGAGSGARRVSRPLRRGCRTGALDAGGRRRRRRRRAGPSARCACFVSHGGSGVMSTRRAFDGRESSSSRVPPPIASDPFRAPGSRSDRGDPPTETLSRWGHISSFPHNPKIYQGDSPDEIPAA